MVERAAALNQKLLGRCSISNTGGLKQSFNPRNSWLRTWRNSSGASKMSWEPSLSVSRTLLSSVIRKRRATSTSTAPDARNIWP